MRQKDKVCLNCGQTEQEFLDSGFLGCADCFTNLDDAVSPVLSRMFGQSVHAGKSLIASDGEYTLAERIAMLEAKLRVEARNENYQEAANIKIQLDKLRDGGER